MIFHKKSLVFVFIVFCLTLPVLISVSAGALITGKTEITGRIPITAYDITVSGVDLNTATIFWRTNTDANGTIEYGTTTTYGAFLTSELIGRTHTLSLYSLLPGTVYHYRVISDDQYGNHGVSGDLTFTTHSLPPTPTPTPTQGGGGGGVGDARPGRAKSRELLSHRSASMPRLQGWK